MQGVTVRSCLIYVVQLTRTSGSVLIRVKLIGLRSVWTGQDPGPHEP